MSLKCAFILYFLVLLEPSVFGQYEHESTMVYPYSFPLKLIPGKRYLTDQADKPFFWSGDAAWSLIAQLSSRDAEIYLENRMKKGFTVIMVNLIEHKFCKGAPANHYGDLPFTGKPFVSPNEKYFVHADSIIRSASERNITLLLAPLYLGYDCKDEGWCEEVRKASPEDLYSWGKFLGNRYKNFSNIIWLIGGDTNPSTVKVKVEEMVRGIRTYDHIHLFSAHNQPESMAITPWHGSDWLTINNVYSYDSLIYMHYKAAYLQKPIMPFFQIESAYENEHNSTPQEIRSYAYWAILSGAMGHVFGNCPIWHFGAAESWCNTSDWKSEMSDSGSVSMYHLQKLFRSREWQNLVPDFDDQIVRSGHGTWGKKDHVAAAITADGNTIIAYLPEGHKIEVNMTRMKGTSSICWWYNPSNGKAFETGIFSNSGVQSFTPASPGDWVLVIDNADSKLLSPGVEMLVKPEKTRK